MLDCNKFLPKYLRDVMASIQNKTRKLVFAAVIIFAITLVFDTVVFAELYMSVSGTVTDIENGKGIHGVKVLVIEESAAKAYSALSDKNGNFSVQFVPDGRYELFFQHSSYYRADSGPHEITIIEGQNIIGLDIQLAGAGNITGRILQKDGITPIKGALITVYTSSDDFSVYESDESGVYRTDALKPTMAATVAVFPDGYASILKDHIAVQRNQTTEVNLILDLDLDTGVKGTVSGADGVPILNGVVFIYGEGGSGKAVTDSSGRFTILGIVPGSYSVSVMAEDYDILQKSDVEISDKNLVSFYFVLRSQNTSLKMSQLSYQPDSNTDGTLLRSPASANTSGGGVGVTAEWVLGQIMEVIIGAKPSVTPNVNILRGGSCTCNCQKYNEIVKTIALRISFGTFFNVDGGGKFSECGSCKGDSCFYVLGGANVSQLALSRIPAIGSKVGKYLNQFGSIRLTLSGRYCMEAGWKFLKVGATARFLYIGAASTDINVF